MKSPKIRAFLISCTALAAIVAIAALMRGRARASETTTAPDRAPVEGVVSDLVRVAVDSTARHVDVIVGPVKLTAGNSGYRTPIQLASIPVSGWLHGFSWFLEDASGQRLPNEMLHHVNLIDPDNAELFSGTPRHVIAAGGETENQKFPGVVGYPFYADTRFLVVAMFANPAPQRREVFLTVRLNYVPRDRWIRPLTIFPFYLDVMGPVGEKDFPVPPGRTERSWEGSPRTDARILAMGGHVHQHAARVTFTDLNTGKVIWSATPDAQHVIPRAMAWRHGGIKLLASHRYRVSVEYHNPSGTDARGMGVVAGVVTAGEGWPALDRNNADYRNDLRNIISAPLRAAAAPHMH